MKMKKGLAFGLALAMALAGCLAAAAEGTPEVEIGGFTVMFDKVSRSGDRYLIEMTAKYTNTDDVRDYLFFGLPMDMEGNYYGEEEMIASFKDKNGLGFQHNICYLVFKTPDGEPFADSSRDWECGTYGEREMADGTWERELKLDAHSVHGDAAGVVVEFHVVTGPEAAYDAEATPTMFIPLG